MGIGVELLPAGSALAGRSIELNSSKTRRDETRVERVRETRRLAWQCHPDPSIPVSHYLLHPDLRSNQVL
jgi:hypothetical protein